MRIGVFLGDQSGESGGAFTFQESICQAIERAHPRHEIVYLSYQQVPRWLEKSVHQRVLLTKRIESQSSKTRFFGRSPCDQQNYLLEHATTQEKIDLVWFVSQDIDQVHVPFIYTVWDLQHRQQPWFPEFSQLPHDYAARESHKESIRRASAIIVPNTTATDELELYYGVPRQRVLEAHHPTPEFVFHVEANFLKVPRTGRPYLIYPAQMWPHKNHVLLIEALKLLDGETETRFDLVLTGSDKGNQKWIQQLTERANLKERVHFLGFVSQAELVGLYQKAFALVYPTFFGPENLPPLEAMGCRIPALVSDVRGARAQYGDAVLYFAPTNEKELANQILKLLQEQQLRETLIKKGYALARERSPDPYVATALKFCDEFEKIRRTWP